MTIATNSTVQASAAKTASGVIELDYNPDEYDSVDLYINVTAVSGTTPSMTLTYQTSVDDGTTYFDGTATAAISTVSKTVLSITSKLGSKARLSYAISGTTPSFTFSVIAQYRRTGL
jgi:hypothetical protein